MTTPGDETTIPGYVAGTWVANADRSTVAFVTRQMGSKVRGRFNDFHATIITAADPRGSSVDAAIDLTTLDTGNRRRDAHLLGPAYLNAESGPTMTYRSTGVRGTADRWIVDGELTLNGITKPAALDVTVNGFREDAQGRSLVSFSATARIARREFGIRIPMDAGGALVSRTVMVVLEIEAERTS